MLPSLHSKSLCRVPCWVSPTNAALCKCCCLSAVHLFPVSVGMSHPQWVPLCCSLRTINLQSMQYQTDSMNLIANTLEPCLAIALHWERFTVVSDLAAAASTQSSSCWSDSHRFHTCTAANPGDSLDLKGMRTDLHQGNRSVFKLFASFVHHTS